MTEFLKLLLSEPISIVLIIVGALLAGALAFEEYFGLKPRKETRRMVGFLGLIILAAGVAFVIFDRTQPLEPVSPTHIVEPRNHQEQPKNSPAAETPSIHIKDGQLLVIDDDKGVAVVEIIHEKGCKATYKWRYALEPRGSEYTGTGQLFEQYAESPEKKGMVVNVRGELFINAGPYKIEWSCSSSGAGWVYPRGLKAYVIDNISLKDFRL